MGHFQLERTAHGEELHNNETDEDRWLEDALQAMAAPCKGVLGPLTRVRIRTRKPQKSRTGTGWRTPWTGSAGPTGRGTAAAVVLGGG